MLTSCCVDGHKASDTEEALVPQEWRGQIRAAR